MLAEVIKNKVSEILTEKFNLSVGISSVYPLSGGDINQAYLIETNFDSYFLKYNYADKFPAMFEAESKGLQILNKANSIPIPEVIAFDTADNYSFLLLEYWKSAGQQKDFWKDFGESLAKLHKSSDDHFGLDHDNYIGSLPQSNLKHQSWVSFFIDERLLKQIKMARDNGSIDQSTIVSYERLFKVLGEIFPDEPPALLHGDLWSGNFMINSEGKAGIIDPAVYYGHREMDIAMTKLFGGFNSEFYRYYNDHYPMEKDWESRMDICNLYPLMVHVNLFGGGYMGQVKSILSRF